MTQLGAKHFSRRAARDMYAMLCVKGGPVVAESYVVNKEPKTGVKGGQSMETASPLAISVSVPVPEVKGQSGNDAWRQCCMKGLWMVVKGHMDGRTDGSIMDERTSSHLRK